MLKWQFGTIKKKIYIFLTTKKWRLWGGWANVICWVWNVKITTQSWVLHMYQQVDSTVHLGNGNIFSILPHKTFPYSGVNIQEWKVEGWLRGDCGMIASLLPYYQLRQVSTGCFSTLESLLSQNSWHHPVGSREALLQGETWATKICFDPNGAHRKVFPCVGAGFEERMRRCCWYTGLCEMQAT